MKIAPTKTSRIKTVLRSPTTRLAGTYLGIIMIMSLGFSLVFYHTTSHELGRQLPPDSFFNQSEQATFNDTGHVSETAQPGQTAQNVQRPKLDQFLRQRIREGRTELLTRLIILNIGALCLGGAVSYALARRTLWPIEQAMEAQIQFVSDASHELRTPLTAIQTSNEVFLRRPKPSVAQAKELITQNVGDIVRLKDLSDGLLSLAKQNKPTLALQTVNLQEIVSEAMTQVVPQATAKNIEILDEVGSVGMVAEQATIIQALIILLDNAVKYSNQHGKIHLTARTRGKFAYLHVQDEGIGIRASDMPHLFRRFYRADNARSNGERSGYGLGLAIAKQIVENQHGTITATSTIGTGSTFTIKLPLA